MIESSYLFVNVTLILLIIFLKYEILKKGFIIPIEMNFYSYITKSIIYSHVKFKNKKKKEYIKLWKALKRKLLLSRRVGDELTFPPKIFE